VTITGTTISGTRTVTSFAATAVDVRLILTVADAAGHQTTGTSTVLPVDNTLPTVTLAEPADGSVINTTSPIFSGSAGTAAGHAAKVAVDICSGTSISGSPVQSLVANVVNGGGYSVAASPALAQDTYIVQAFQSDVAGTYSASTYSASSGSNALTVGPRTLTVIATGVDKVYDGTLNATVTLSDNRLSGDVFTDSYTSNSFTNKNVGTAKSVSVSGIFISGTNASDYTFNTTASTTADITARPLTVSALGINNVYDGTTTPTASLSDDRVSGDILTDTDSTATFADKNVGTGKTISVSGISISGTDAANYTRNTSTSTSANITAQELTGHFTANSKTYDSTLDATTASRTPSGVVGTDDVQLAGGVATFETKTVADGKTVTASGFSLSGTDAANYSLLSSTLTTSANITPVTLRISATGLNKVYDGTTTATVSLSDNRLGGDALTDGYTSAAFADPNVGTAKPISVSGISIPGTDAGNYALQNATASTTANVTTRPLTVTINSLPGCSLASITTARSFGATYNDANPYTATWTFTSSRTSPVTTAAQPVTGGNVNSSYTLSSVGVYDAALALSGNGAGSDNKSAYAAAYDPTLFGFAGGGTVAGSATGTSANTSGQF
jgi:hypothetical protein